VKAVPALAGLPPGGLPPSGGYADNVVERDTDEHEEEKEAAEDDDEDEDDEDEDEEDEDEEEEDLEDDVNVSEDASSRKADRGGHRKGPSQFTGVTWSKSQKRWMATCKGHWLGYHPTEQAAAQAGAFPRPLLRST
jgi:hypothetical protein